MRDLSCALENRLLWVPVAADPGGVWTVSGIEALRRVFAGLDTGAVDAVILVAGASGFPNRFALDAYGDSDVIDRMRALTDAVEACPLPVIAALQGNVANEGLELALAAHYRVASPATRFAMTQMTLGLIPTAGGTQRLPRLTSARDALDILLNGRRFSAQAALERGILDGVLGGDFLDSARDFASEVVAQRRGPRPTGRIAAGVADPVRYQAQMEDAHKAVARLPVRAAGCLVECVQAAQVLPIQNGLALEASLFRECQSSAESLALRNLIQAEHALAGPRQTPSAAVVLGHGSQAVAFAVRLVNSGVRVIAPLNYPELREKVVQSYTTAVEQGQISSAEQSRRLSLLTDVLAGAGRPDLVIDDGTLAAPQVADSLSGMTAIDRPPVVLWLGENGTPTNGAAISVSLLKSPVTARTIELRGPLDDPTVTQATALMRGLGFIPVQTDGGVADRLRRAFWQAADALVLLGTDPRDVDQAMLDDGFSIGPLAQCDLTGLDQLGPKGGFPVAELLCENDRSGRAAGLGFFRYLKNDPRPRPDGVILWVVAALREKRGIVPVEQSHDTIRALFLGAMWAAGMRMLQAGQVARTSDIDVLAVHELGFPRHRGGPMHAAHTMGEAALRQIMQRYQHIAPEIWTPPGLSQRNGDDDDHKANDG